MATRSTIAIQAPSGKIKMVYCHYDGYLSGVGAMLLQHYSTARKVNSLVSLGSLSYLQPLLSPPKGSHHKFGEAMDGVTVAYARDRGEELIIGEFCDYSEYIKNADFQEFNYIFMKGKWYYHVDIKGLRSVADSI